MGVRAVVVAVDKHHATVLVAGGQFKRVKIMREKLVVGQEIDLSRLQHFQARKKALGAVTALASILMGLNTYLSQPAPVATAILSIDIKPSINMVVGGNTVLEASALDSSGRKLLQQISLQGMPIQKALYRVTRWAKQDGYLSKQRSYVVLGAVFRSAHFAWFSKLSYSEGKLLKRSGGWHGRLISVSTVTHKTLRDFSDRHVSVGRYLLWKEEHKPDHRPSTVSYRRVQQSPLSILIKKKLHPPGRFSQPALKTLPHLLLHSPSQPLDPVPGPSRAFAHPIHRRTISHVPEKGVRTLVAVHSGKGHVKCFHSMQPSSAVAGRC